MNGITASVYFGIFLSVFAYKAGMMINKKFNNVLTNPLFLSFLIVAAVLKVFRIPAENFAVGGDVLQLLIMPATVCLALPIYNNFETVKKNLVPIIAGTAAGSLASVVTVVLLCRLFGLDAEVISSLLPRSVTMPIALDLCRQKEGVIVLTTAAVMISGVFGAMVSPFFRKIFKLSPVETGLAIGTCSHVAGTAKAVELGETEGALSGIAIGFAGVFTVLWVLLV